MKSLVFKSAWKFYRDLEISFSYALKLAWASLTADKLAIDISIAEGKAFNFKAVKSLENKLNLVCLKLNNLMPCKLNTVKFSNSGAAAYYDGKTFNND